MNKENKYSVYLKSNDWKLKKSEAFSMFGRLCARCSSTKHLHVHHATYDRIYKENVKTDLFVLCVYCHNLYHSMIKGKTTIKMTRDFIHDKYTTTSLEKAGRYDELQEKIKLIAGNKKKYKTVINKKYKHKETGNLSVKNKGKKYKRATTNYKIDSVRLKKITQAQDNERIRSLRLMLSKGLITQEYFNSKIK